MKRIGEVAYQLALPAAARIHDVFHVLLLKPFKVVPMDQPFPLLLDIVQHHPVLEPRAILKPRVLTIEGANVSKVLVWWQRLQPIEATWEQVEEF